MTQINKFGEIVHSEHDLFDLVMRGNSLTELPGLTVESTVDIEQLVQYVEDPSNLMLWSFPTNSDMAIPEFDLANQKRWYMPDHYRDMDVAQHVLALCRTDAELQRVGQELLLYQERDMFDLLRYLCYLVDVMRENHVIWGVGRGSSVASYVLYLLGVHRIDSLYYDLDPHEFLR